MALLEVRLCIRHEASCLLPVEVACLPLAAVEELMLSNHIGRSRLVDAYIELYVGSLFGMQCAVRDKQGRHHTKRFKIHTAPL